MPLPLYLPATSAPLYVAAEADVDGMAPRTVQVLGACLRRLRSRRQAAHGAAASALHLQRAALQNCDKVNFVKHFSRNPGKSDFEDFSSVISTEGIL